MEHSQQTESYEGANSLLCVALSIEQYIFSVGSKGKCNESVEATLCQPKQSLKNILNQKT